MKIDRIIIGIFCVLFISNCKNKPEISKDSLFVQSSITIQDCYYQNNNEDVGIGLLLWVGDCEKPVSFFNDKNLTQNVFELIFCNQPKEVCPIFYKPDYDIMHFAVKSKEQNSYEVYVNDLNTLYLSANKQFVFVTWEDFLLNHTMGIREINGKGIYKIITVNNDTITVKAENSNEQKQIKWKEKGKIIIEIMLLI